MNVLLFTSYNKQPSMMLRRICLSMSIYPSLPIQVYLPIYLSMSIYPSLSIYLCIYLCLYVYACLFTLSGLCRVVRFYALLALYPETLDCQFLHWSQMSQDSRTICQYSRASIIGDVGFYFQTLLTNNPAERIVLVQYVNWP